MNQHLENKLKIGKNKKYALIIGANPSQGARSPKLWNKVYKSQGSKTRMYPADVKEKKVKHLIQYLKKDPLFIGGSVTIPYKILIIQYLDKIDSKARKIGSVNTIKKINKKLIGFNTDYDGSIKTLNKLKDKKKILILGCGGAAKAVIFSLFKKFKSAKFFFYNRSYSKIKNYLKSLNHFKRSKIIKNNVDLLKLNDLDLLVNTTSIGFDLWIEKNKEYNNLKYFTPLTNLHNIKKIKNKNLSKFIKLNKNIMKQDTSNVKKFFSHNLKCDVLDIIYKPKVTKLIKFANSKSNNLYNGLEMNLIQAVKAFMIVNKSNKYNLIKKKMKSNG